MDRCAGKRLVVPGKASGSVLRENMYKKDENNVSFGRRIGCSAKVTPGVGFTDNNRKVGRPPICSSSNGKEIAGSSSRTTPGGFGYLRKPAKGRRQPSSNLETESSETSSVHDDSAAAEPTLPRLKTKRGIQSQNTVSGGVVMTKAGRSNRGTSTSSHQESDLDTRVGPSVSSSSGSDRTVRDGLSRNGLRNLRCNSMSNVLPTSSSSATKISVSKKKNSDGESSSSSKKGNKSSVSVLKGMNQSSSHENGTTLSDNRRNRVVPTIRDSGVVSSSRSGRRGAVASPVTSRQTPHRATPTNSSSSRSSNSYSRQNRSTGRLRSLMPGSPSLVNRDGLSRYNINGIAEILLALERIEHDQELTYEQLASLETNLFLSDMIRFYDQHSDMRLDIDNMSYEELLALGDEMGTVSTALSEEALSRSLKRSIYQETDETGAISLKKDDDIKCSICQEEYVDGDEVGTMPCEHMYHVSCVQQWLRMKNWCPICKTSAEEEKSL
ncbi:E3 ubiquitin-protein ligase MBR2 isoform X1 [Brassica rapa]|uniref:RING-type E3 ubiquitin transferase n=3 Tax=Brassica campestris TaxID=3711 RepID=M4CPD2_BRACM|nr:E3 ubiquitin-protein ligase MBR2 isoform X1 [Brassica rapa]XP_018512986.1 E3 ubiquitin-protein ligase MBR2 isoform X1 [Brassica rapa]XP_033142792.1 E3 ubiquitin-protein ligase MBR2 isoform X1 [Brassica rapa]